MIWNMVRIWSKKWEFKRERRRICSGWIARVNKVILFRWDYTAERALCAHIQMMKWIFYRSGVSMMSVVGFSCQGDIKLKRESLETERKRQVEVTGETDQSAAHLSYPSGSFWLLPKNTRQTVRSLLFRFPAAPQRRYRGASESLL